MKHQIYAFIIFTILFLCISHDISSEAFTSSDVGFYVVQNSSGYIWFIVPYHIESISGEYLYYGAAYQTDITIYNSLESCLSSAYTGYSNNYNNYYNKNYANLRFNYPGSASVHVVYIYNMPKLGANVDPVYPQEPTKSWWENLSDWVEDLYGTIGDIFPGDPLWQWVWDTDGNDISELEIIVPSIAPTPTEIPYQTVIVPVRDPSTGDIISYNYEYHYNNPSGTPIVATAPPEQPERKPTGSGSSDNYNPQDPLAIPTGVNWINPGFKAGAYQDEFSNPLGTLSDGLDMISYSFSSASGEYTQGVSGISQSFQFIPSSWFMLIGMGAAIIILAGIINRFLG